MAVTLSLLLWTIFLTGCGSGISLSSSTSSSTDAGGGLPGHPAGTTLMAGGGASAGSGILTGSTLTVLVRTGATAFRGQSDAEGTRIADPFFEAGMEEVVRRATED